MLRKICAFVLGLVLALGAGVPLGGVAVATGVDVVVELDGAYTRINDVNDSSFFSGSTIIIPASAGDSVVLSGNSKGYSVIIANATDIKILGGTVIQGVPGIPALTVPSGSEVNGGGANITITGGSYYYGSGGHGIYSDGALIISGNFGSITGGEGSCHGIYAKSGSITINAQVTAKGGSNPSSGGHGIYALSNSITINAQVTAKGGDSDTIGGHGIYAPSGSITINAQVTATGGREYGGVSGHGIYAPSGSITINAKVTATGGGGGYGGHGIYTKSGSITIDAEVNANGGVGGGVGGGHGIYAESGSITINAQVTARGGDSYSGGGGYAILAGDEIIFDDPNAKLIATDGTLLVDSDLTLVLGDKVSRYTWLYEPGSGETESRTDNPFTVYRDTTIYTISLQAPPTPKPVKLTQTAETQTPTPVTPAPTNPYITSISATPYATGAKLEIVASSGALTQYYQWQYRSADGAWINIPGATVAAFDWTGLTPGETYTVRCTVSNSGGGFAVSGEVAFTMEALIQTRGIITGMNVNVRQGANTRTKSIGKLHKNAEVVILGYEAPSGWNKGFYRIEWKGGTAYVSADYVYALFGEPIEAEITGRAYLQTSRSTSSKHRARTLGAGDGVMVTGRYKTWWIVEDGGEMRYLNNGKYVAVGEW